jgi:hypothetical protein
MHHSRLDGLWLHAHPSEPAMVGFDTIVCVTLSNLASRRDNLVDHSRVDRRTVGGDLDRRRPDAQCTGEDLAGGRAVAAGRVEHVDDLAVLIDRRYR